jgi:hypothetical protein
MDDLRTFLIGSDSFGGEGPAICIPISSVTDSDIRPSGDRQEEGNRPPREKPKNSEAGVPPESNGLCGKEFGSAPPVQKLPNVSAKLMARYDRVRLYEDVWIAPLKNVAGKLGISPQTLAEVCKKLHIPLPEKGHWNKLAAGKPVGDRPSLEAVHFVSSSSPKSQRISGKNPATVSGRLMERYNREELYEDAWKFPFTRLEVKWGTSAPNLSTICKALHIPVPGVGYWNKIAAGKPVPARLQLPAVTVDPHFLTRKRFSTQSSAPAEASNGNVISGESAYGNHGSQAEKPSACGQGLTISNEPDFISDESNEVKKATDQNNDGRETAGGGEIELSPNLAAQSESSNASDLDHQIRYVSGSLLHRYNREVLYEKAWEVPMIHLAKEWNVSDAALIKACKKLLVPIPPRGYWARVAAGKPVESRPLLPEVREKPDHKTSTQIDSKADVASDYLLSKYDRDEIYQQVWSAPLKKVAEEYEMTPSGFARVCRKLKIPIPGSEYWNKRAEKRPDGIRPPLEPLTPIQ